MMMTGGYDIILIEDSDSDAEVTLRALRRANFSYSVMHITDGEKALAFFREIGRHNEAPRLILLDLKMPKINGLQVIEQVKHSDNLRYVPLVVLSSSREDKDIRQAHAQGAQSYVVKPVDYENFSRVIVHTVQYWLTIHQGVG